MLARWTVTPRHASKAFQFRGLGQGVTAGRTVGKTAGRRGAGRAAAVTVRGAIFAVIHIIW